MSKAILICSVLAMLYAFCGLTFYSDVLEPIWFRFICIGFVVIPPTMILYHDYSSNAKKEDGQV